MLRNCYWCELQVLFMYLKFLTWTFIQCLTRAFLGEWAAHLNKRIEEENEEILKKNCSKLGEWRNIPLLPTRGWGWVYGYMWKGGMGTRPRFHTSPAALDAPAIIDLFLFDRKGERNKCNTNMYAKLNLLLTLQITAKLVCLCLHVGAFVNW